MDAPTIVATEAARIAEVGRTAPDAPVPSCEGWTVAELIGHLGGVYRFVLGQLRAADPSQLVGPAGDDAPEGDDPAALVAWFETVAAALVDELRAAGSDRPVWTFADTDRSGFYHRRMIHESTVHRSDAEAAVGDRRPIDADRAMDGIDELLTVGFSMRGDRSLPASSLHLHRTDGEGEWMLKTVDGELAVTHEHAKGDAAARGSAADLFLFLWGRGRDGLECFGDEDALDAWSSVCP